MKNRVDDELLLNQFFLKRIESWFASDLGKRILHHEIALIEDFLVAQTGAHIGQISVQNKALFSSSPIENKFLIDVGNELRSGIAVNPMQLPFGDDSIDILISHHFLDFVDSKKPAISELGRVISPAGSLILIGFNPISLWGLFQFFGRFTKDPAWSGKYVMPRSQIRWLSSLGFRQHSLRYSVCWRPNLFFKESDESRVSLPIGSIYVLIAKKWIEAPRIVRPEWGKRNDLRFGLSAKI